jgi:hypothetical protein
LHPLPSEFLIDEEKFLFFFISVHCTAPIRFCNIEDWIICGQSVKISCIRQNRAKHGKSFKGIGSPDGYFFAGLLIRISILTEHAQMVFKLLAWLVKQKNKCIH